MAEPVARRISFSESDLLKASATVEARCQDPVLEATRVEVSRRLLRGAMNLETALRIHTRCALVNHCGSHGNSNLCDAAIGVFEAMGEYVNLLRETAHARLENPADLSVEARLPVKLEVA